MELTLEYIGYSAQLSLPGGSHFFLESQYTIFDEVLTRYASYMYIHIVVPKHTHTHTPIHTLAQLHLLY